MTEERLKYRVAIDTVVEEVYEDITQLYDQAKRLKAPLQVWVEHTAIPEGQSGRLELLRDTIDYQIFDNRGHEAGAEKGVFLELDERFAATMHRLKGFLHVVVAQGLASAMVLPLVTKHIPEKISEETKALSKVVGGETLVSMVQFNDTIWVATQTRVFQYNKSTKVFELRLNLATNEGILIES